MKNVGDMMVHRHEGITSRGLRDGFTVLDDTHHESHYVEYMHCDENGNTRRDGDDWMLQGAPYPKGEKPGFLRRAKGDER
jgi:hypothetical protein